MKDSWLMRQTPRTVSRIKTLAVILLLGALTFLALLLGWFVNSRSIS